MRNTRIATHEQMVEALSSASAVHDRQPSPTSKPPKTKKKKPKFDPWHIEALNRALHPDQLPSPYRVPFLEHLHSAVQEFADMCKPSQVEMSDRNDVVQSVMECARQAWGDSVLIVPFGSTATGFLLPNSDIDLVALNVTSDCLKARYGSANRAHGNGANYAQAWMNRSVQDPLPPMPPEASVDENLSSTQLKRLLYRFAEQWKRSNRNTSIQVIAHARVPIVKLKHRSGICVDLCINQRSGIFSSLYFLRARQRFPMLHPLVLCIKHLLICASQRSDSASDIATLLESFKGGLSSFSVQCLVLAHLHWQSTVEQSLPNLGHQLVSFLHFFGWIFDSNYDGIRIYEEFVCGHSLVMC